MGAVPLYGLSVPTTLQVVQPTNETAELDVKAPGYLDRCAEWVRCIDVHEGQEHMKYVDEGIRYLSPTVGMLRHGMNYGQEGFKRYKVYREFAICDHHFQDGIKAFMGMLWSKPPKYENLPKRVEYLLEKATYRGESLQELHRQVNLHQLKTGRTALLGEVRKGQGELPYLCRYNELDVWNWDENDAGQLNLVVMDESGPVRDGFRYRHQKRKHVLSLEGGVYRGGLFESDFDGRAMRPITVHGRELEEVPFVFINATGITPCVDAPPLHRLALADIKIFRGEADFRWALHASAIETLVVRGKLRKGAEVELGPGAVINPPSDGDAKFIGPESKGLMEMRTTLENDRASARVMAGQLIDTRTREKESGEALRIKIGAQTVTLLDIALNGALGIQRALKLLAKWMGCLQSEIDAIKVTPNVDFTTSQMEGQTALSLIQARNEGFPLCLKSMHRLGSFQGLTEMTYEQELVEIAADENTPVIAATRKAAEAKQKAAATKGKPGAKGAAPGRNTA